MRKWDWYIFTAAIVLVLVITGCASTIGNKARIDETTFEIGKTTKQKVADTLGFPAKMTKDKETGMELWGYQDTPDLVSVDIATVYPGVVDVTSFPAFYGFSDAAVVYVFDKDSVLVDVKTPEKEKK